jgi:hypothetical protein
MRGAMKAGSCATAQGEPRQAWKGAGIPRNRVKTRRLKSGIGGWHIGVVLGRLRANMLKSEAISQSGSSKTQCCWRCWRRCRRRRNALC